MLRGQNITGVKRTPSGSNIAARLLAILTRPLHRHNPSLRLSFYAIRMVLPLLPVCALSIERFARNAGTPLSTFAMWARPTRTSRHEA